MFRASDPQAPESDDARAKQRRRMHVIETAGKREHEIRSRHGKLGEPAIHRVARESGCIAKIFRASTAIRAGSVDAAEPGNTDSCPEGKLRRGPIHDLANNLVTWDQRIALRGQLASDDVQIGSADSTSAHAQEHLARLNLRRGNLTDDQGTFPGWLSLM